MNKCFFTGNVASQPELKGKDSNVLTFRLAVNGRVYDSEKEEWIDKAEFIDCVMYGKRANAVGQWLEKGAPIVIEAHARQNVWQGDDGANKSRIEFEVDDLTSYNRPVPTGGHAKA